MSIKARAQAAAVLWSLVVAVVVTGIVHALAFNLPDWLSARSSREAGSFEKFASRFSEAWMANAFVWAGLIAAVTIAFILPLLLWRASVTARRITAANPSGSGAG
jgi:hypothetical protein